MQSKNPNPVPMAPEMSSLTNDVVVLCWETPTKSDRAAHKIAAFLGADANFVSLASGASSDATSIPNLGSTATCLIVDVETLAKASDAMPIPVSRLHALIDLAEHVFIYGFKPTERHGAILRELSSGGLLGVQPLLDPHAKFQVAEGHREWCGQFSGLSFDASDSASEDSFVEGVDQQQQTVIIRAGRKPFFVHTENDRSQVFFLAGRELADLDESVQHEVRLLSWFSKLAPLMMFLRGALRDRVWHNDQPRACFIIDDPLLREGYGFLDYARLAESMREHRFSTSIAFIPWNYRRSDGKVAKLFSSRENQAFLCVHGCDHTGAEFATTQFESLRGKAELALERMQVHRSLSGVPFDDVMVFPQGLFSVEAMMALNAAGYLAAVNSDVQPSTTRETLPLRDLLDVAVTRFADFPLFGRRYPCDVAEFAFDLFLGKPALAVEHHGYFRDGYEAIGAFVDRLKSLDEQLEWTNLATICSEACLTRTGGEGRVYVRFYTNRFRLTNAGAQTQKYLLLRRQTAHGSLPSVTLDQREWSCEQEDGYLKIQLSLDAGQTADIRVLSMPSDSNKMPRRRTGIHDVRVGVRRFLSEFRDNHVETSRILSALVSTARHIRRDAKATAAHGRPDADHSRQLSAYRM